MAERKYSYDEQVVLHALVRRVLKANGQAYKATAETYFEGLTDAAGNPIRSADKLTNAVVRGFRSQLGPLMTDFLQFVEWGVETYGRPEDRAFLGELKQGGSEFSRIHEAELEAILRRYEHVGTNCRETLMKNTTSSATGSMNNGSLPSSDHAAISGSYVILRPSTNRAGDFTVYGLEIGNEIDDRNRLRVKRQRAVELAAGGRQIEEVNGRAHFTGPFLRLIIEPEGDFLLKNFAVLLLERFANRSYGAMPGFMLTGNSRGDLITAHVICLCVANSEERNSLLGDWPLKTLQTALALLAGSQTDILAVWLQGYGFDGPTEASATPTSGGSLIMQSNLLWSR